MKDIENSVQEIEAIRFDDLLNESEFSIKVEGVISEFKCALVSGDEAMKKIQEMHKIKSKRSDANRQKRMKILKERAERRKKNNESKSNN